MFISTRLKKTDGWCSPLLRSEFRDILALYLRENILTSHQAPILMGHAETLMADRESSVSSREVLALTGLPLLSSDDCEFVALAQREEIPLVTADRNILKAFPTVTRSFEVFLGPS